MRQLWEKDVSLLGASLTMALDCLMWEQWGSHLPGRGIARRESGPSRNLLRILHDIACGWSQKTRSQVLDVSNKELGTDTDCKAAAKFY
jgi:hypothetical protein